jgi:hypothetical protein
MHDCQIPFEHLDRMTDCTGLVQHANYSVPRRDSGYTTDDNARALRLCARAWRRQPDARMASRVATYLSFLEHARVPGGGFHNFLSYQRHWLDEEGGGDCQGQVARALAEVLGGNLPDDFRALARDLIEGIRPSLAGLQWPRAMAYVILAWARLWTAGLEEAEPLENLAWTAARRLVECYQRSARLEWQWFEPRMTYANAVMPHALFAAAQRWPKECFLEVAVGSFAFLDGATTTDGVFWPIGNRDWYPREGEKALYDQQPVEAGTMAEAALAAYSVFGEEKYLAAFRRARDWFHGQNSLGQPLADVRRGACCDGLREAGVNRNQGAESTLGYLTTALENIAAQPVLFKELETASA